MDVITLLSSYFIGINLIGFALMGIDKYKARKRAFRIPEATLFKIGRASCRERVSVGG